MCVRRSVSCKYVKKMQFLWLFGRKSLATDFSHTFYSGSKIAFAADRKTPHK
jgi:hypothetical protein